MRFNIQNPSFLQMAGSSKTNTPFYIVSRESDNVLTFSNTALGTMTGINYSINGSDFSPISLEDTLTLSTGDTVMFINNAEDLSGQSTNKKNIFNISGQIDIFGDIALLLYPSGEIPEGAFDSIFSKMPIYSAEGLLLRSNVMSKKCYSRMFVSCTDLTIAPKEFPAKQLKDYCYSLLFSGCSSLTKVPAFPAKATAQYSFDQAFKNCTSLTTPPELPATSLSLYCYTSMFYGCSSLTIAPELPALVLAQNCYYAMFQKCTALVSSPILPAKTLINGCYGLMFKECSLLSTISCLAEDIDAGAINQCTTGWIDGVAENGVFIKPKSASFWNDIGPAVSKIPAGWTVQDYIE